MKIIATADWHLRLTSPACFTGTEIAWADYQRKTLEFIYSLGYDVCIAGDIFDVARPAVDTLNLLLSVLLSHPATTYIMHGNHEEGKGVGEASFTSTAYGTLVLLARASLGPLQELGLITDTLPSGAKEIIKAPTPLMQALFVHTGITEEDNFFYGQSAEAFLSAHPSYPAIIAGDNHKAFVRKIGNQILINPGCITTQRCDMVDIQHSVVLFDTDNPLNPEVIPIPIFYPELFTTDSSYAVGHTKTDKFSVFISSIQNQELETLDVKSALLQKLPLSGLTKNGIVALKRIFPKLEEENGR
jgi:hypothetical protein